MKIGGTMPAKTSHGPNKHQTPGDDASSEPQYLAELALGLLKQLQHGIFLPRSEATSLARAFNLISIGYLADSY